MNNLVEHTIDWYFPLINNKLHGLDVCSLCYESLIVNFRKFRCCMPCISCKISENFIYIFPILASSISLPGCLVV